MADYRLEKVRHDVQNLYTSSSDECMRVWFYDNHVAVVAMYGERIAKKVGADVETVVLASLFHDVARAWDVTEDPHLMNESLKKAEEIMRNHRYNAGDIERVKNVIITHSCREVLPETEEGKVMATADAVAHLMTDFYLELPFNGWLRAASNFPDYKAWVRRKIERDFHTKIFYPEYKELVKDRYEAFKAIFTDK